MYVREFGAAWLNPDLRPFAGRAPVKSKCMGFAGYFARWQLHQQHEQCNNLLSDSCFLFTDHHKPRIQPQVRKNSSPSCSTKLEQLYVFQQDFYSNSCPYLWEVEPHSGYAWSYIQCGHSCKCWVCERTKKKHGGDDYQGQLFPHFFPIGPAK